jgi:hypothetical protein
MFRTIYFKVIDSFRLHPVNYGGVVAPVVHDHFETK